MRGATHSGFDCVFFHVFQSTRPMRGATGSAPETAGTSGYFNPRAPYGARLIRTLTMMVLLKFQSTRPIRGATLAREALTMVDAIFQSTRPIRGATPESKEKLLISRISIHAPHTGRDTEPFYRPFIHIFISIHAPHTGRDDSGSRIQSCFTYFNPRAPYGARLHPRCFPGPSSNFNPRAPYGARLSRG